MQNTFTNAHTNSCACDITMQVSYFQFIAKISDICLLLSHWVIFFYMKVSRGDKHNNVNKSKVV